MPFKKGPAAWRRTFDYLRNNQLVFKDNIKVCTINYDETKPESDGLRRFIFWNLPQIQHKNPKVQCVQFKNLVKTPHIAFYTLEENEKINTIHINCYDKKQDYILDQCTRLVCKTAEEIQKETQRNEANFGKDCSRYCICLVEGQVACPRFKPLPEFMRGKYFHYKKDELDEIRKKISDEEALKQYWSSR